MSLKFGFRRSMIISVAPRCFKTTVGIPIQTLMVGWIISCFGWAEISGLAQGAATGPGYRTDRILIKPKPGIGSTMLNNFHTGQKSTVLRSHSTLGGLQVLSVPKDETAPALVKKYQASGLVEYAE